MSFLVVSDSGCDLTLDQANGMTLQIVPAWVSLKGSRFRDAHDLTRNEFYTLFDRLERPPETEPPTTDEYSAVFWEAHSKQRDVVAITISRQLSRSYHNAVAAARGVSPNIYVIDSQGASAMQDIMIERALRLSQQGIGAREAAELLDTKATSTHAFIVVSDMTFFGKSARIPRAIAAFGQYLNLSMLLRLTDRGSLSPISQSRDYEATLERLVEHACRSLQLPAKVQFRISHAGAMERVCLLVDLLTKRAGELDQNRLTIRELSPTMASHLGRGALGLVIAQS